MPNLSGQGVLGFDSDTDFHRGSVDVVDGGDEAKYVADVNWGMEVHPVYRCGHNVVARVFEGDD